MSKYCLCDTFNLDNDGKPAEEVGTGNHVTKSKRKQTHVLCIPLFQKLCSIKLKLIYFNVTII